MTTHFFRTEAEERKSPLASASTSFLGFSSLAAALCMNFKFLKVLESSRFAIPATTSPRFTREKRPRKRGKSRSDAAKGFLLRATSCREPVGFCSLLLELISLIKECPRITAKEFWAFSSKGVIELRKMTVLKTGQLKRPKKKKKKEDGRPERDPRRVCILVKTPATKTCPESDPFSTLCLPGAFRNSIGSPGREDHRNSRRRTPR